MVFRPDLHHIKTRNALLTFLGVDEERFDAVCNFSPAASGLAGPHPQHEGSFVFTTGPFFQHDIPKQNSARGYRSVWEAESGLTLVYKALARRLDSFFHSRLDHYPHDSAYGYRVGRNIRENAAVHAGRKHLLVVDITDFFPTISLQRIDDLFRDLGLNDEIADLLARFVTIDGALPAGLSTSPPISNAIATSLDVALKTLADSVGAAYTRYADDLSFSSNDELPDIDAIRAILGSNGFQIADAKTRRSKIGQAHFVTGLSISDPTRPHVPQRKKRRLRQELHYARKYGLEEHLDHIGAYSRGAEQHEINRLDGSVKFVSHHEPGMAGTLRNDWRKILLESGMGPSFAPKNQDRSPFYIFIDEAEYSRNGMKMLALGMSVSQHQDRIVDDSRHLMEEATSDVYGAGKLDEIRKKGLHFADASEDLKLAYAMKLAAMPFEGYVAFDRCPDSSEYETVYIRLLKAMISRRLMAAESQFVGIVCEKNSKVTQPAVQACIEAAYIDLRQRNDRHPKSIGIDFVSKPNLGISVPDFLLGILGNYLQKPPAATGETARHRLMFERLRDKYRLILDVSEGVEYSRRRPIEPWV